MSDLKNSFAQGNKIKTDNKDDCSASPETSEEEPPVIVSDGEGELFGDEVPEEKEVKPKRSFGSGLVRNLVSQFTGKPVNRSVDDSPSWGFGRKQQHNPTSSDWHLYIYPALETFIRNDGKSEWEIDEWLARAKKEVSKCKDANWLPAFQYIYTQILHSSPPPKSIAKFFPPPETLKRRNKSGLRLRSPPDASPRATELLETEVLFLQKLDQKTGICITPLNENLFHWQVEFCHFNRWKHFGTELMNFTIAANEEATEPAPVVFEIKFPLNFPERDPMFRLITPPFELQHLLDFTFDEIEEFEEEIRERANKERRRLALEAEKKRKAEAAAAKAEKEKEEQAAYLKTLAEKDGGVDEKTEETETNGKDEKAIETSQEPTTQKLNESGSTPQPVANEDSISPTKPEVEPKSVVLEPKIIKTNVAVNETTTQEVSVEPTELPQDAGETTPESPVAVITILDEEDHEVNQEKPTKLATKISLEQITVKEGLEAPAGPLSFSMQLERIGWKNTKVRYILKHLRKNLEENKAIHIDVGAPGGLRTKGSFWEEYTALSAAGYDCEKEMGGKVCLPASALQDIMGGAYSHGGYGGYSDSADFGPMVFEISGPSGRSFCGVYEFNANDGQVLIPDWIMKNISATNGTKVQMRKVSLPPGTFFQLQPHSSAFQVTRGILEWVLRRFVALTEGDTINVEHDGQEYAFNVLQCKPARAISITDLDISVDFAEALDGGKGAAEQAKNKNPDPWGGKSNSLAPPTQPKKLNVSLGVLRVNYDDYSHETDESDSEEEEIVNKLGGTVELTASTSDICPNCRQVIAKGNVLHTLRTCQSQNTYCTICEKVVPKSLYEKHMEEEHAPVTCPACEQKMENRFLAGHRDESCPKRVVGCSYCELSMEYIKLWSHERSCGAVTEYCSKCRSRVPRSEMKGHSSSCTGEAYVIKRQPRDDYRPPREELFQCEQCNFPCGSFDDLQVHVLTEHAEELDKFDMFPKQTSEFGDQIESPRAGGHHEKIPAATPTRGSALLVPVAVVSASTPVTPEPTAAPTAATTSANGEVETPKEEEKPSEPLAEGK